jgi:uncharacterized protein (TIGR02594 family)
MQTLLLAPAWMTRAGRWRPNVHTREGRDSTRHVLVCSLRECLPLEEAGIKGTHSAAAASFLHWGTELVHYRFGMICIFKRPKGHHVGFFVDSLPNGNLLLLGGNQHNMVTFSPNFKRQNLLGFRWPSLLHKGEVQDASPGRVYETAIVCPTEVNSARLRVPNGCGSSSPSEPWESRRPTVGIGVEMAASVTANGGNQR